MLKLIVSNRELMQPEEFGRKVLKVLLETSTNGGQLLVCVKEWSDDDDIIRTGGALGSGIPPGTQGPVNNF